MELQMNNNEILTINAEKISSVTGYSKEEIAIVKSSVAKNTTDTELAYFLNLCKSVGLNPFNKEIWCYKDNKNNLLVFAGRDGFLSKAQSNPAFNGIRSSEVRSNDVFDIDIANNKIVHNFGKDKRGEIIGAYAIVFRKGGEPTIEYVDFNTFNKGWNVWKTNPAEMIKKVAETHALKKAFGISGIQSEYDFEVKNDIAIPIQIETEDELNIKVKELIDLIDTIKDIGLQAMYKDDYQKAKKEGKVDINFVSDLIQKVKKDMK
jgi:phage recombination protein Bet